MKLRTWLVSLLGVLLGSTVWAPPGDETPSDPLAASESPADDDVSPNEVATGSERLVPMSLALDRTLAAYAEAAVEHGGVHSGTDIARLLAILPHPTRTYTICEWALSPRDSLRMAVVASAVYPTPTVGLSWALQHLTTDPNPRIRVRAKQALRWRERMAA